MALNITLLGGLGRSIDTGGVTTLISQAIVSPSYSEPVIAPSAPAPVRSPYTDYAAPAPMPVVYEAPTATYAPPAIVSDPILTSVAVPEPRPVPVQPSYQIAIEPTYQAPAPEPAPFYPSTQEPAVLAPTSDYPSPVSTRDINLKPILDMAVSTDGYQTMIPSPSSSPTPESSILQPVQPVASEPVITVQPFPPASMPEPNLPTIPPLPQMPVPQPIEQPTSGPRVEPSVSTNVVPVLKPAFVMPTAGKWAIGIGILAAIGYGVHRARKRRR